MGLSYKKDMMVNWLQEIGKFLRLIVDPSDRLKVIATQTQIDKGYEDFFGKTKEFFEKLNPNELQSFLKDELHPDQIRPLALLLMNDGLIAKEEQEQQNLLQKAKFVLDYAMTETGTFAFEDFGNLSTLQAKIK